MAFEHLVQHQRERIGPVADMGEPRSERHDAVVLVAVGHKQPPAVCGLMHRFQAKFDAGKGYAAISPKGFIMIAGHEDDPGSVFNFLQDRIEHAGLRIAPIPGPFHPPAIDDVSDEVERLTIAMGEEVGEQFGFAAPRAEMGVGDEERTITATAMRAGFRRSWPSNRRQGGRIKEVTHGAYSTRSPFPRRFA